MKKHALIFLMTLSVPVFLFAQHDSTQKHKRKPALCEVKMTDGSTYKGFIEKHNDSTILLKSGSGVLIHIPKTHIVSVAPIHIRTATDSLHFMNNHSASTAPDYYAVTRNAFLFREHKFYGSSNDFLFYHINYAFTKNLSLGLSSTPILLPAALNFRGNFEISHKLFLGFTATAGNLTWSNSKTYALGGLITITYGDEHTNYSFYGGFGDYNSWIKPRYNRRTGITTPGNYYIDHNSPFAGAAILTRFPLIKNTYLTAESFVYPSVNFLTVTTALRTNIKPRISWVFGLQHFHNMNFINGWSPLRNWAYITIPYIGFSYSL